jgi:Ni,Fe-hydrogenase III small subunit/NAD-dependent dihydropyrimidine dehydrogenase PreA subunit
MLKALIARLQQGHRTAAFPTTEPALPDRFRGLPTLDASRCPDGCQACSEACPTGALTASRRQIELDLGRCLFCTECSRACPEGAVTFTNEYRLAARARADLVVRTPSPLRSDRALELSRDLRRLFGRSLKLRQVSAGGCNGCEADVNVLGTLVFDLGRFGIQFVASPRHADGLLITGPVTENMRLALQKTYDAVPDPKIVIAVGACAISGGPYIDHREAHNGADAVVPVDLYVPGCPPHPYTVLEGLLGLLGRMRTGRDRAARQQSLREGIRDETLKWGTDRANQGIKLLGADIGHGPPTEDERRR